MGVLIKNLRVRMTGINGPSTAGRRVGHDMTHISLETLCAEADHFSDAINGDVVPALHITTAFARNEAGELPAGLHYSRYGNPTVLQAEAILAKLDGAREARLFGSGLAAASASSNVNWPWRACSPDTIFRDSGH
jgi:cystathionine beta-lyase/cystathionine gamma-synthase